ncbi:MAG TPA: chemotaxis protein CheA [Gemmatimonadaceae bacterium]|nr:chemotaxis protein CheA [Gemmatimonadaceae bacterium]
MDSSQYADLFLTESREHVSAINQWLLQLEREGAAASAEPVSAIFRAVHTVKGMSATMGYVAVAELSHELETLLDRVRRGELAVNAELMDLLFRSADVLEAAIEGAVTGRTVATDDVLRRLRAFADARSPGEPSAEASSPNEWTAPAPIGSGILVRVRLVKEAPLKGVRAFLVVQALRRLGDVLVVNPSVAQLQAEQFGHDFALRLSTTVGETEIERVARGAGDVAAVRIGEDGATVTARSAGATDASSSLTSASAPATPDRDVVLAARPKVAPEGAAAPNGAPRAIDLATEANEAASVRQSRHVRIDLRRLDSLMNLIGELVITRGRLLQIATGVDDPALSDSVTQASRLIGDLRDEIMTSRMVPVWQVFDRFPRLVRDASRSLGKRIEFTIEGKEIELDRSMLDEIGDPIVHLLRNAIDHGIESPEERTAAGKPAAGKLRLSAARDRSAVVIRVSDDGRGIDRDRVLTKARSMGLVDGNKSSLSDDELLRIIGRPGFSTADRVTDLSGRGVGIDAVYTRVRALGGAVDIRSQTGQGTTATLRLPLTLAIVRALLARAANEVYAIPLTHVSETVELNAAALRTLQGREVLVLRSDVLPVLRMRELVGLPPRDAVVAAGQPNEQVVIIDLPDRRIGLVVDELGGQQEIVVKQFDGVKDGLSFFGGATILGNGSPALIVDVSSFP